MEDEYPDEDVRLELLGRRNSMLKEMREAQRANQTVDPSMMDYLNELNAALEKY